MTTHESENDMTKHLHYITHTHDGWNGIKTQFTCTGDRTSPCHQSPDCDCAFLMEECTHTPTPHDECWAEGWMTEADCAELCGPKGEPVRSCPINVTWNGDCVEWEYVKENA